MVVRAEGARGKLAGLKVQRRELHAEGDPD